MSDDVMADVAAGARIREILALIEERPDPIRTGPPTGPGARTLRSGRIRAWTRVWPADPRAETVGAVALLESEGATRAEAIAELVKSAERHALARAREMNREAGARREDAARALDKAERLDARADAIRAALVPSEGSGGAR